MTENKHFYLKSLDGFRALSIILVMIYHATWFSFGPDGQYYQKNLWELLKSGGYGVSIFFSISGFLITTRILEEIKLTGSFSQRNFYIKRFFRILPPFYFYLLIVFILGLIIDLPITSKDIFTSLSFTRIYTETDVTWFTGHIWSLCVEEHFYILLSIIFAIYSKKTLKINMFLVSLIFIWNILSFRFKDNPTFFQLREALRVFSFMDYMFLGAIFAELNHSKKIKFFDGIKYDIFFIFTFLLFFISYPLKIIIQPILVSLMICLATNTSKSYLVNILENSKIRFIGHISYSLYLWQQLFMVRSDGHYLPISYIQTFPINIVLTFTIAYFSYRFIELPFVKYGRHFLKGNSLS